MICLINRSPEPSARRAGESRRAPIGQALRSAEKRPSTDAIAARLLLRAAVL